MPIAINGSGTITGVTAGGYPDASVNTEDLNAGTASAGQTLVAAGATGAMSWGSSIVLGTPQNSTSGTSIDFTGIPSWVKRITVMFNGVSLSGSNLLLTQIGTSSGVETTGYRSSNYYAGSAGSDTSTSGFISGVYNNLGASANTHHGSLTLVSMTGNIWVCQGALALADGNTGCCFFAGSKTLSGVLDRVRITRTGSDTFDAGSINIQYE